MGDQNTQSAKQPGLGMNINTFTQHVWGFPGVQMVKNLPAMQETWVQSLGREDPLEKGMATLSSILAWKIP